MTHPRRNFIPLLRLHLVLLSLVVGAALFAGEATSQTPKARSKECEEILQQVKGVKGSLISQSNERATIRRQRGLIASEMSIFPERGDRLREFDQQLGARERELDKSIEPLEKSLDALLEQLADCCPKEKKATEGPDVPGLDEPDVPGLEEPSSTPKSEEKTGMTPFKPNQATNKKCEEIKKRISEEMDSLVKTSDLRGRLRGEIEALKAVSSLLEEAGPKAQESVLRRQVSLANIAKGLGNEIDEIRNRINFLVEALAKCCCPEKTSTDGEPDVPGLEEEVGVTPFKPNQVVGLFSIIREDSTPRFNTYGFNGAYTYFITPSVGLTGDFNAHFTEQNGTDLSKIAGGGGLTFVPFDGAKTTDKATVSLHALGGISHFKAVNGITSFTDNAFYMKLGGALDINVTNNFFFRPIQFDYAPTFFGNSTQHNVQFGFGGGFRF